MYHQRGHHQPSQFGLHSGLLMAGQGNMRMESYTLVSQLEVIGGMITLQIDGGKTLVIIKMAKTPAVTEVCG